jgi:hypothetical protein
LGTTIAHFRLSRLEDSVARTLAESAGLVVKRAEAALILAFSPREKEETSAGQSRSGVLQTAVLQIGG